MKISKRYGRRAFLTGAGGALVGLPFLEALAPRSAKAATAPKRFLGYWYPNGYYMLDWRPTGAGANFTFGPNMGAGSRVWTDGLGTFPTTEDGPGLDSVKDKVMLISGLTNTSQPKGVPGDHSGGTGSFMTNRSVAMAANAKMGGPSVDYVIAQTIGKDTKRPYLAMGGEKARAAGVFCDSGFNCVVGDHISFDTTGNAVTRFDDPGQIFDQLFMGIMTGTATMPSAADLAAAARRAQDKSILDLVTAEATSLQPKLSRQDRPRLDEYLTSVREVEKRINALGTTGGAGAAMCMPPMRQSTAFNLANPRQNIDIAHELIALAFQCDATRVISFQWGNSTCNRPHNMIGAAGGHHDLSHHGTNVQMINKVQRIDYWWFRRFTALITRLKGMTDIDGKSVLDNTLIFQGTDVSDGAKHNHDDMPVVLAGGAAGFRMGQHVMTDGTRTFGDLFLAILAGFGVNNGATFGELGTAPLSGLTSIMVGVRVDDPAAVPARLTDAGFTSDLVRDTFDPKRRRAKGYLLVAHLPEGLALDSAWLDGYLTNATYGLAQVRTKIVAHDERVLSLPRLVARIFRDAIEEDIDGPSMARDRYNALAPLVKHIEDVGLNVSYFHGGTTLDALLRSSQSS